MCNVQNLRGWEGVQKVINRTDPRIYIMYFSNMLNQKERFLIYFFSRQT